MTIELDEDQIPIVDEESVLAVGFTALSGLERTA